MSVLQRELTAYQDAVDQYNRQAEAFKKSMLTDANGNVLVYTNGAYYAVPPGGGDATRVTAFTDKAGQTYDTAALNALGGTTSAGDPNVSLIRQNPTSTSTRTVTGIINDVDEWGISSGYLKLDPATGTYQPYVPARTTKMTRDPSTNQYTATEYTYSYIDEPAAVKGRPDPTAAQLRRLTQPTLAEQERGGLIANEIQQGGVLSNPGRKLAPAPTPQNPDPIVDNPPVDWTAIGGGY